MAFHGIEIFEVLDGGNLLNGIYTNKESKSISSFTFGNEVMRKSKPNDKGPEGDYTGRYLETDEENLKAVPCTLKITRQGSAYELKWRGRNGEKYKGIGLMVGSHHMAVSFVIG